MAARSVQQQGTRLVKPLLSVDKQEAKRRVLNLYRAWYRQVPYGTCLYHVPVTIKMGRAKVRELFMKNQHVTDIRTIDMLVIKGQMELVETAQKWKQPSHLMNFFKDTVNPKPADFLSKFYEGQE